MKRIVFAAVVLSWLVPPAQAQDVNPKAEAWQAMLNTPWRRGQYKLAWSYVIASQADLKTRWLIVKLDPLVFEQDPRILNSAEMNRVAGDIEYIKSIFAEYELQDSEVGWAWDIMVSTFASEQYELCNLAGDYAREHMAQCEHAVGQMRLATYQMSVDLAALERLLANPPAEAP